MVFTAARRRAYRVRRRAFITLLGNAAAWPLAARAQLHDGVRRIGMLMAYAEQDDEGQALVATFRAALASLGWVDGRNIHIDVRWAPASANAEVRLQFAKELIAAQPQMIISHGTPNTATLQKNTRTIPLVFTNVS